MNQRWWVQVWG